jgi:NADPH:quinone reductase-like Zn-dependent oxidoreductase
MRLSKYEVGAIESLHALLVVGGVGGVGSTLIQFVQVDRHIVIATAYQRKLIY